MEKLEERRKLDLQERDKGNEWKISVIKRIRKKRSKGNDVGGEKSKETKKKLN